MEFIGAKSIRSYLADDAIAALDALPDGDEVGRLGRQSFRRPPPIVVDVSGTGLPQRHERPDLLRSGKAAL